MHQSDSGSKTQMGIKEASEVVKTEQETDSR